MPARSPEPQKNKPPAARPLEPEKYARLRQEAAAPYKGLRRFIYVAFGASGAIGGFIFLTQILAGREIETALPNLGVQVAVVALMVWLYRLEGRQKNKP